MEELTPDLLSKLYLEDHLSENAIAKRFGTNQVRIGRLRKRWGIPLITKSDRLGLPETLSSRQEQILLGSMLGDGSLREVGAVTARYEEHHKATHKSYLDWLAVEWDEFYSSFSKADKGLKSGWKLITHASKALFPYWENFYPKGEGSKTFSFLDPDQISDLALAVWFMGDGSRTGSSVRFSVGTDSTSVQTQLKILRKFNLKCASYGSGGDQSIHIQGSTSLHRFVDLVSPHLHSCMGYKLEAGTASLRVAPRDALSKEVLTSMTLRGMSNGQIGKTLNVSRQSVSRAKEKHGLPASPTGRRKGTTLSYSPEEADSNLKELDQTSSTFLEDSLLILSRLEIPLPKRTEAEVQRDIDLLFGAKTKVSDGTILGVTRAGSYLCEKYFPHRYDAYYRSNPSVRSAWYDQKWLKQAIKYQISVKHPVTVTRVFRALRAILRAPTNFRPCFAKALAEYYTASGETILDPCAGYGGRAAGILASGRTYIGVDPHPNAPLSYEGLAKAMGKSLTFLNLPFEDVSLGNLLADMVFTSPPYFSVERYSPDSAQSWVRYKTWESWDKGFLQPMVAKSWSHLKAGGVFLVNTKDVNLGGRVAPIAATLVQHCLKQGFLLETTGILPLGQLGKNVVRSEPFFVFRKPTE